MDINEFVRLAIAHAECKNDSPQSLKRANSIVDQLRSMMLEAFKSPGQTDELMSLLDHPQAGPWIAYCALENLQLPAQHEARCLDVIRALASSKALGGAGAVLWLANHGYGLEDR